ncbi:Ent-kaurene oxidase [Achaetomium macrosporum]|uniref:Ent-kaurene oxidase n=1 Tax=Achaetomium macrosporum TaxID=79813 RepID=A0AAN7C3D3_9PEZI|nr:Ent-kaurene oxidase [Achaetomium macrosporum]
MLANIQALAQLCSSQQFLGTVFTAILVVLLGAIFPRVFRDKNSCDSNGLFTANKRFSWEPSYFARFRWITNAQKILQDADSKAQGKPYLLARGDTDLLVLPPALIPELNRLGADVLNSREYHAHSMLGALTGMGVVRKTSFHVRVLLSYISPALPAIFALTGERVSAAVAQEFPRAYEWTVMKPQKAVVRCVIFQVTFAMRCVPACLHPLLVWLLPARWGLVRGWRKLTSYVVPRVLQLKEEFSRTPDRKVSPDVISWMVEAGRTEMERDPEVLTRLVGSVAAGSTYSIANFCCRTIMDLISHPDVLAAVRAEIREKHAQVRGRWDMATLASMEKLESAMKETARLAPGSLLVYSRVVKKDHVLSNGLELKKGQFVTMSGAMRTLDPDIFEEPREYRGLRFCAEDRIEEHRARPFGSLDTDILAFGAGRWACPGRLISGIAAKILLVKLLDEYDFGFVGNKPLERHCMHEFLFFHPENKMLVRRREDSCGVVFV